MKRVQGPELNELVLRAVEVYNRYRSPEAIAKLVKLEEDGFIIEFKGSFCLSCGAEDYFEDFIYELKGLSSSVEMKIQKREQTGPQSFRVRYNIKGSFSGDTPYEDRDFQEFLRERGLSVEDYMTSNPCTKDVMLFHFRNWLSERESRADARGI